jgi:alpha-glucoside transport system permease protein
LVNATGWWTVFTNWGTNEWTFENYSTVLSSEGFGNAFLNSLSVTIPATVIPITIAAFAAYAFAWMHFPGRQWVFVGVVALLVVPLQMSLIPLLTVYVNFDLNGTFPAVWLAHTGFGLPLAVYLLRNYIGSLPSSMMESARIDGATHYEIFTKLVVPLSVPVLASFAIFQFLWVWNDLLVALVFLGGEQDVRVVTLALRDLNGSRGEA